MIRKPEPDIAGRSFSMVFFGLAFCGVSIWIFIVAPSEGFNTFMFPVFVLTGLAVSALAARVLAWSLRRNRIMKHNNKVSAKLLSIVESNPFGFLTMGRNTTRQDAITKTYYRIEFEWTHPGATSSNTDKEWIFMLFEDKMPQTGDTFSIYADSNNPDQCAVDLEPNFSSSIGDVQ